jgi:membrane fusion protein (multidrug efflux system)
LPGTLEAWEDLTLAAELPGMVKAIGLREGDRVHRGEVIARIDPETQEAELIKAEADLSLQKKNLARLEQLLADRFVSEKEVDEARKALEVARAELHRANVDLDKSIVRSPVDGILDQLLVDRGEYVTPGTPIALVVQVDRLKALVEVPEKDIAYLQTGQPVQVLPARIDGPDGPAIPGEVIHVAYKADPLTRTFVVKVAVENPEGRLRPGMILRVALARRSLSQVVTVPLSAVMEREGGKVVLVEDDGLAHLRPVVPGAVVGDRLVIRSGLEPGERLIVRGQQLVADGARVRVDD